MQAHPINAARIAEGKPAANIVLLRGCGSRCVPCPFQPNPTPLVSPSFQSPCLYCCILLWTCLSSCACVAILEICTAVGSMLQGKKYTLHAE